MTCIVFTDISRIYFLNYNKMKKNILFILLALSTINVFGQQVVLRGGVFDAQDNEPLIGASIVVKGTTRGTIADLDGKYELTLSKGKYDIVYSFVGYASIEKSIDIQADMDLNVSLGSDIVMKEVVVSADIAIDRKTPVAFSNIGTIQLKEELAGRDLPMVLNATPGAYATQSGGGDGDARISIRGFNQRNVAVMLDGIPVNDMENGQVYWSNWFGLGLVTKTMQVQRGLGSSKLAVPSVGGTINILTKGIDSKAGFDFKQELGLGNMQQTTVGFTSGRLKKGWGITATTAFRQNDGIVGGTYSKAIFYFLRIDKEIGKHLITLSGFGGPQEHGQRAFASGLGQVSVESAKALGLTDSMITFNYKDKGVNYNDSWGYMDGKVKNTRVNFYYKPQYSLRHAWNISRKTFLSNVAYLSIGTGGGTGLDGGAIYNNDGQLNLEGIRRTNQLPFTARSTVMRASMNNHFWYGGLSTLRHEFSKSLNLSAGIDLRSYKGEHYRTVYDMLGGTKFLGSRNARVNNNTKQVGVGDRYYYDYNGYVRWAGLFGVLEYTKERFSAFANISSSLSSYKYQDNMYHKTLEIDGKKYYTAYTALYRDVPTRTAIVNGTMYTIDSTTKVMRDYASANSLKIDSTTAQNQTLGWINLPSYTFKSGFSYKINSEHNVFVNVGYLSRATRFNNVFASSYDSNKDFGKIQLTTNYKNELIRAFEIGYNYRSKNLSINTNAYYTNWKNKPFDSPVTVLEDPNDPNSERIPVSVNGIGALHTGIEIEAALVLSKKWKIEGLASIGDWEWSSPGVLTKPDGTTLTFDATGYKVGDAAQVQVGGMLRYEPTRSTYISCRATYFDKNYANFSPDRANGQPWKMPSYTLTDINFGKRAKVNGVDINFRASILNVFDALFITDANNNDYNGNTGNNAASATVFYSMGRRWTLSVEISL